MVEEKINNKEKEERLKELKVELIKQKIMASKGSKNKIREIKKEIAKSMLKQ